MLDANDMELLRDYARRNSESAFAELVQRHLPLVYSAALRHVEIPAYAEEITQAVFVILSRKAASLRENTVLAGWLYETTRLTALRFLRGERRRQFREQEAYMQSTVNSDSDASSQEIWNQLSPMLDEAMARLGEKDRNAVILRFFKEKSVHEVAATMLVSEAAAQRRVSRALEKLRKFFTKRGVVSTAAIIAGTISTHSVQAAPIALAKSVTAVAIAKGSIATASTLTLVKGTMKIMTLLKMKTAAVIGVTVVFAAGASFMATKGIAQSSNDAPAIDDSAWAQMDTRVLENLPAAFILRPTHFSAPGGRIGGGMTKSGKNKMLGRAIPFATLIGLAYDMDVSRMVLPSEKVNVNFDLLMTTADASREKLQKEIEQQLGYTAHRELQPKDVLDLTLKQAGAPGLKPSQAQNNGGGFGGGGSGRIGGPSHTINSHNQPISALIRNLQGNFDQPIVDRTGLTGNFDVSLAIKTPDGVSDRDAIIQALSAQLGLDLVPGRDSVEMLVVEKVKN
jgi:uncharacterized protein (TIGR03435 family)